MCEVSSEDLSKESRQKENVTVLAVPVIVNVITKYGILLRIKFFSKYVPDLRYLLKRVI